MVFSRVLELAVSHHPVRYPDLIAGKQPRAVPQAAAAGTGTPAEPGAPSGDLPLENRGFKLLRLSGDPSFQFTPDYSG